MNVLEKAEKALEYLKNNERSSKSHELQAAAGTLGRCLGALGSRPNCAMHYANLLHTSIPTLLALASNNSAEVRLVGDEALNRMVVGGFAFHSHKTNIVLQNQIDVTKNARWIRATLSRICLGDCWLRPGPGKIRSQAQTLFPKISQIVRQTREIQLIVEALESNLPRILTALAEYTTDEELSAERPLPLISLFTVAAAVVVAARRTLRPRESAAIVQGAEDADCQVNGERNPEEVYRDFRAAILQILGSQDDTATLNGVSGVGVGAGGIPGEIVGVEPAPTAHERDDREGKREPMVATVAAVLPVVAPVVVPVLHENGNFGRMVSPKAEVIRVRTAAAPGAPPATVWVVGGPGSNKASLCQRAVARKDGWLHFSIGQRLRALADAGGGPASDGALARSAVSGGELVPRDLVTKLVRTAVSDAARTGLGLVLDGYPRDVEQMEQFQAEFRISPRMLLLDCSKLQLGRGRRDDSVAAFRRRLEVFRELSLPMLKHLDQNHRLVIVDGDTDSAEVQEEFSRVLLEEMEKAEALAAMPEQPPTPRTDVTAVQQFAHAMSRMGGGMANGLANGAPRNGHANGTLPNGYLPNGNLPNGNLPNGFGAANNKVKPIIDIVSKVPTVSQMTHDEVRRLYEQSSGEITMNTHI